MSLKPPTTPTSTFQSTGLLVPTGWIDVTDTAYGAIGDGVTDDTAAIQRAINAVTQTSTRKGGTIYFPPGIYKCTSQLSANRANSKGNGVRFLGAGGVQNSFGGNPAMASTIRFTGTGSGSFLDFRSTHGVQLLNLGIEYTSASYTGTLIDFQHDTTAVDAAYALIQDCMIGGLNVVTAAACVSFYQSILCRIVGGKIGGAVLGVKFAGVEYSNANKLDGVTFDHCTTAAIANGNQTLAIDSCWFEGTAPNALARAYIDNRTGSAIAYGVSFRDCWFGDSSSASPWVDFGTAADSTQAIAFNFSGNVIVGGTGTGIKFDNGGLGVSITGNIFSGVTVPIDLGPVADGVFDGVTITGNYLSAQIANSSGHRNLNISGNAGPGGDNNQPFDRIALSGHIYGSRPRGTNPSVVSNTANGSSGTATLSGESADMCGTITLNPAGAAPAPAAGVLATVTLGKAVEADAFSARRPKVQLQARNDNAAGLDVSNDATGTTTFTVRARTAPVAGQTYIWDWFMVGGVQ